MRLSRTPFGSVSALIFCACMSDPLLGQSLLVHLQFEGGTTDSSPNGRDGTLIEGSLGGSSYIAGPVGMALKLDHDPATITTDKTQGTYVSIPLRLPTEGSLVFWYRVGDLYNYQSVWDTSGNGDDWEMWIYGESGTTAGIARARLDANVGQTSHLLDQPCSWYHIAYTWKRGDQAHFWCNGVERDTASTVRGITEAQFDAAILGDTFFLGGGNAGNTFSNGAYDDVRIYDAALDGAAIGALMALGTPPAVSDPTDPAALLLKWDFEEGTTGFEDSSGNARDGTPVVGTLGSYEFEAGPVGRALKLNHDPATLTTDKTQGVHIQVPLRLPEAGAILFWYRPAPYYNYQNLFNTSGQGEDWEMWIYNDGRLRGRVDGNVGQVTYQLGRSGEWYHIAYTWWKGGLARVYVNGVEGDLNSIFRGISDRQYGIALLGDTFFLGGSGIETGPYGGNTYGTGAFDDFRIYQGIPTAAEIATIYEAGEPPQVEPPALELYLKLDGNLTDASGKGRDGTLVTGAQGSGTFVETAKIGGGLDLDHEAATLTTDMTEGACVSAPLALPVAGTIALWYYVAPYYNNQTVWDSSAAADDWEMWISEDGVLHARIHAGVGEITYDLDNLSGPDNWYHIAYAWDQTNRFADLYVNGNLVGSAAAATSYASGDTFYLGGGNPGNTYGVGIFDEVRVYDAVLKAAAIRTIMQEGLPPGIRWTMDGDLTNSGTLGAAYDGTASSGPYGAPVFLPTLHGEGLLLDNVDPAAHMTEGASVSVPYVLPEAGSIALWYYAKPYYNYQSIFDNSVQTDDWEMWIYNDGRLRVRIDAGSGDITYDLANLSGPNNWYHIVYAWDRAAALAGLYLNGQNVGLATIGAWIVPGEIFYLGGGNELNTYGNGIWDDVRIYDRVLTDAEIAALGTEAPDCPTEGDTHVSALEVTGPTGPLGKVPGTYTATTTAADDSGDSISYTFTANNGVDPAKVAGPQAAASAQFDLTEGTWTIRVDVDDNLFCPDAAPDASTSTEVVVGPACPEAGDTHATALEVTGPTGPLGQVPGTYTATATATDDSGDAISYTFTADNGVDPATVVGPQAAASAQFELTVGAWTIRVEVDDDACPDVAGDATFSASVAVSPACPEAGDTHVTALEVTGPAGLIPGTYTATATASDDSGDAIAYTFTADNGVDPATVVGPQAAASAQFELTVGAWTIRVDVDDDACPDIATDAAFTASITVSPAGAGTFIRGNCNGDAMMDISDAIFLLTYSFLGGVEKPDCLAACDANGDGQAVGSTTDPIYILYNLFLGGPRPLDPFPGCGPGLLETDYTLGCETSTCTP
jgi:hypothetical protein